MKSLPSGSFSSYASPFFIDISPNANAMLMTGGKTVNIFGENMGKVGSILMAESGVLTAAATFQTRCQGTVAFTQASCLTVAGVGGHLYWRLTLDLRTGDWSDFHSSYATPGVSSVQLEESANAETGTFMENW